jgi:hypothetical protein
MISSSSVQDVVWLGAVGINPGAEKSDKAGGLGTLVTMAKPVIEFIESTEQAK